MSVLEELKKAMLMVESDSAHDGCWYCEQRKERRAD